MQIPKIFLVVCAAAVSASLPMAAQGQDSEEQAKARQALREKMRELEGQAPAVETQTAPVLTPAGQTGSQRVVIRMEEAVAPADPEAIQKAREAMRRKMDELGQGGPQQDTPEIAKAREALRQKMQEVTPVGSASVAGAQSSPEAQAEIQREEAQAAAERRAKRAESLTPTAYKPLPGPGSPLSATKQERLAELLRLYRAEAITPEQYHTQRAKILAEP